MKPIFDPKARPPQTVQHRFKSEKQVEADIVKYLKGLGNRYWGVKHGQYGVPDRLGVYRGVPIIIEVKKSDPSAKATVLQAEHIRRATEAGAVCVVAHSVDDVKNAIAFIDRRISRDESQARGYDLRVTEQNGACLLTTTTRTRP